MPALKILQLTDPHILPHAGDKMLGIDTEQYFQNTLAHAHVTHGRFDLILLTGDLGQDPCADSYRRICRHLQTYRTPCLCLPGNHDDWELMKTELNAGFVSCRKHLLLENWQIIALNSQKPGRPSGFVSQEELAFLQQTLSTNDMPALLAIHHHCVASRSSWMDTMRIENGEELLTIVEHFPQVKAITCGHLHQEMQTSHKQIAIFAAPASCFQFKPLATEFELDTLPPGYRVFELFDNGDLQSRCFRLPISMNELQTNLHSY
ncbi:MULTISPECIES: 3',5'-cyclic-AMP phosphodiesterase [Methylomonas]|uniref:Phosphoesterase n=2 Tax=Methylomonas TaxID=416 RepID=A0A126T7Z3_9GAMM|nr:MULTISPECIES: 3',5'-cyclic-AMP phosphodiesterase [Methylomonas]AMK78213.1 phosphoesterase [Methylomonas denitrificans]OAI03933.1 phosphodiesterase [Methylomonas methanica]TCV87759.1 Icc protein [Methylomonas methanica]